MGPSGWEDSDTPDEGIKEVKVGPKKKVSSSGWAVNSRRRGVGPSVDPDGKVSFEWNGWSRPRMTGSRASATYRPGIAIHPHFTASRPLMLVLTVGQRGILHRAFLRPCSPSFFLSLHTSYRFQHTQSPRRKPSLRENIYTFPNLLTVSRIAACPALGWSILSDNYSAATCLLLYAGITDWVSVRGFPVWRTLIRFF